MRKFILLGAALMLACLWVGPSSAANGDNLRTITADTSGTGCPSIGTGLAFDGTHLLLSCWSDSKIVLINPADGSQAGVHTISGASSFGAIAWDNGRHVLWACKNFGTEVGKIDMTTDTYTGVFSTEGCTDGLAYDGSDDTLWTSPDATNRVTHSTATGAFIARFFPPLPCGNSGIAVGGPLLYLATNGCTSIYTSPKDFSSAPAFFASFSARLEDLEYDNVTFAPRGAIWSKDAYDNILNAWEIPAGSCLFGGGRSDLTLDPPTGDNETGTSHTVTAHLTDQHGPVSGAHILFTVTGANTTGGDGTTNSSGDSPFTYTGTNPGDDTITACYDKNSNNICDPDETTATAHKHWRQSNADISVVKSGPSLVQDGSDVTYTIEVTNNGPATATNVTVTDAVPAGTTYVSSSAGCSQSAGVVTCTVASLASGSSATFTITVHVNTPASSISNTATGTSDQPDPDRGNNTSTKDTRVNHAPNCSSITASGPDMWPPNHKFRTFTISGGTDPDGGTLTVAVTGVRQDEPLDWLGDGDTSPDAIIVDPTHVQLRGERSGVLNGRVYYITVVVADGQGGSCTGTATVGVPHDQGPKGGPIGEGPLYNSLF